MSMYINRVGYVYEGDIAHGTFEKDGITHLVSRKSGMSAYVKNPSYTGISDYLVKVGQRSSDFGSAGPLDVWVHNGYAIVCFRNNSYPLLGAYSFDLSNPTASFYTLISYSSENQYGRKLFSDGNYIFTGCDTGANIYCHTFDGISFTYKGVTTIVGGNLHQLYYNGTYLFVTDILKGIYVYSLNEGNPPTSFFTLVDSITSKAYRSVFLTPDGFIFAAAPATGIDIFEPFNGSNLILYDSVPDVNTNDLWGWANSNVIYSTSSTYIVSIYLWDGSTLSLEDRQANTYGLTSYAIRGGSDDRLLYTSNFTGGMNIWSSNFEGIADFTSDATSGNSPLTINFSDNSSTIPDTWEWDFGDGSPKNYTQNPTHVYTTPGKYTVSLKATFRHNENTRVKTDYIAVGHIAVDFIGSPLSGEVPLIVNFESTTSPIATEWEWDFGDGSAVSNEQNPKHIYQKSGTFTVSLTASIGNATGQKTVVGYITVPPYIIDFIGIPRSGAGSLEVQFINGSTGISADGYLWDFGDGETSAEVNPKHFYARKGLYDVKLTLRKIIDNY